MKKTYRITTVFGTFHLSAQEGWRRLLVRGPWVVLLVALSVCMALTAKSELARTLGARALYVAMGSGCAMAFVAHAAFVSWCSIRRQRAPGSGTPELVDLRLFGWVLIVSMLCCAALIIKASPPAPSPPPHPPSAP